MNGFTDKPVNTLGDDIFGITQYISGLNEFILECDTPMTIAIQGDWGSGKTSMMNMIREQLGNRVVTSWFNTWQYSQFNMGDSLAVSFLSRLISDLDTEQGQKNEKMKKVLKAISGFVKNTGVIMIDTLVGGKAAETVENGLQAASEQGELDMSQAISELKTQFQAAVNAKIAQSGKDRLVIFIDDLDRLQPGKAVELLEVLKLFLDCDGCVFVLAIDYAVVSQGVKQKYGELLGEEKGRSFFDKIIQVPFKMPVAQYDVVNYVTSSLQALGIELSSEEEAKTYVKLIQTSVGCNPRAMKRLFNAFLLLNKVAGQGRISDLQQRKMLFAILCLQLSFEKIYNYIVRNPKECDSSLFKELASQEAYQKSDEEDALPYELHLQSADEIIRVVSFMTVFHDVLDQDRNGELSDDEIRAFIDMLKFSTITSSTSGEAVTGDTPEDHYRWYNRDIVKDALVHIDPHGKLGFRAYQSRTDSEDWRKYYAGGWTRLPCVYGRILFEFKIATHLQDRRSDLSIWIAFEGKRGRQEFREHLESWYQKQRYGFVFLEDKYGFWLGSKTVDADARDEIIAYFKEMVPKIVEEVLSQLQNR